MRTVFSNDVFERGGVQAGVQWVKPVGLRLAGTPVPDHRYAQRPQAAPLAAPARPSGEAPGPAPATGFAAKVGVPRRRMGQFGDVDLDDLPDLIADLPAEIAESFTQRLDDCFSLLSAGQIADAAACGQKLYREIQALRNGQGDAEPVSTTPRRQDPPSEFPWIPVAIGAAGVGVLIYILAKKG